MLLLELEWLADHVVLTHSPRDGLIHSNIISVLRQVTGTTCSVTVTSLCAGHNMSILYREKFCTEGELFYFMLSA